MPYKGTKNIEKYNSYVCSYCGETFERLKCLITSKRTFCNRKCKTTYFSEVEHIKHNKQFKKGLVPWNKGLKGIKTGGCPKGTSAWNKGRTNIELFGRKKAKQLKEKNREQAIKNFNNVPKNDTNIEKKVENYLLFNNILYVKQFEYKYGIADFWIPENNLIIEVDGKFWHNLPEVKRRDYLQTKFLFSQNFNVLRIKENDILNNTYVELLRNAI